MTTAGAHGREHNQSIRRRQGGDGTEVDTDFDIARLWTIAIRPTRPMTTRFYRDVKLLVTCVAKATRDVTERDLVTRGLLR